MGKNPLVPSLFSEGWARYAVSRTLQHEAPQSMELYLFCVLRLAIDGRNRPGRLRRIVKADPANWAWAMTALTWLQQSAWLSIPVLTLGLGLMQAARSMIGPPWIWETVHYLLDRLQEHVFEQQVGTPLHYHRVTLFRYVRLRPSFCRWPWSGWLVPVERSGHTTRKSRSVFLAPDDADRVEGIAGQTWAQKSVVIVENLPDLSGTHSLRLLEEYAHKTWVSVEWLQSRTQHARSFRGIPVEVKGRLWGVIVLDSRSPTAIDQNAVKVYRLIGRYLGKLLERA